MDEATQTDCGRGLRYHVIYRNQWITTLILVLCVGSGIVAIQALVQQPTVKCTLTLVFVIIALLLACANLCTMFLTYHRVINPLEQMQIVLSSWTSHLQGSDSETLSVEKIKDTLRSMDAVIEQFSSMPTELKILQTAYSETLKTLQLIMEKAARDSILLGMGKICGQVAHDMRSPIGVIKAGACLALKAETPEDRKMANNLIEMSTTRLNKMADELLEYRKATAVECKPMDLSAVVNGICQELGHVAHGKNVQLDIHVPEGQDFFGDGDKLGRVLQNLMSNAIQAVERQGDGQVQVQMHRSEDHILLNIRDNGPGIPSEYADQMFKAGFTTKGKSGNGLGLIYCANVVKAHGGQITASNRPEGGAEIAISLPYETAH